VFALAAVLAGPVASFAQQISNLADMSVEDLLNIRVTTAGKMEQRLARTAASVYVITAEEIRRSGLTSVPEVLRLAPGVQVAQINPSIWAIAIHGFNSRFSNKLLVLVDGRSVYSSTIAQVFWTIQDIPLDDVERIEIIRGPGGSLWGANAADGVINIITRNAKSSRGGLLSVSGGGPGDAVIDARYGGPLGRAGAYRVSARYGTHGAFDSLGDGSNFDRASMERLSSRLDWASSPKDSFTGQADLFHIGSGENLNFVTLAPPVVSTVNLPISYGGGNALMRWEHILGGRSKTALQTYYDREDLQELGLHVIAQTIDIDFQHEYQFWRNALVWGGGFRVVRQDSHGEFQFNFDQLTRIPKLFSLFAQDEIAIQPNRLLLTVGCRLEHNDFTGIEAEPTIRFLWSPRPEHSIWTAVSRAVRSPATFERGGQLAFSVSEDQDGVPILFKFSGNPQFISENLIAYESGYRLQPARWVSLDLTGFYNVYHRLSGVRMAEPVFEPDPVPPHVAAPFVFGNLFNGRTFGSEVSATYTPLPFWRVRGSYSWLRMYYLRDGTTSSDAPTFNAGANPTHQMQVHSYLSLPHQLEMDTALYWVDRLPEQDVPGYTRLDTRLGWSPGERIQLSAGLQNLLAPRHLEFNEPPLPPLPSKVPRSAYAKVVWRF
jgi:iron complex outermembrane receptor protein